jgi:NADH dehydrogenase
VTLWAAGVKASSLGTKLGVPLDRNGRVIVDDQMNIPGHAEVFVIGDLAHRDEGGGKLVPGVAQGAMQAGDYAARAIAADIAGRPRKLFRYFDKGNMATIGRNRAVAEVFGVHLSGLIAWLAWLLLHLLYLIGFRNRAFVLWQWAEAYFTLGSGVRLITGSEELPGWQK